MAPEALVGPGLIVLGILLVVFRRKLAKEFEWSIIAAGKSFVDLETFNLVGGLLACILGLLLLLKRP
jgi:hypothetical protein